jgi:1,4-dihydroxy-2-naphthoyl-CoA hydrolase
VSEALSSAGEQRVTLDRVLGFELFEVGAESARGKAEVGDQHRQPYGIVHGGVYAALAETVASVATAGAVYEDGKIAVGMSNFVTFMRPISSGTIHAEAIRKHRGSTTWVWEVEMTDDDGRLCASSRVTVAVRPPPQARSPGTGL